MYFDSHAHLDDERFGSDLDAVMERARETGVCGIVTVGQDRATSEKAALLSSRYPGYVHAAVGIHPHEACGFDKRSQDWIVNLCEAEGVVAIGETGLDYYYEHSTRAQQKASLEGHLEAAVCTRLPVIIHCRDGWPDCLEMLERYRGRGLRGIAHCFSGGLNDAQKLLELGFLISFAGNLTFPKAESLRQTASRLPLARLAIESDSPYLAPQSQRGRRNEPAFIAEIASQLSSLHSVSVSDVGRVTADAARALYGIQLA